MTEPQISIAQDGMGFYRATIVWEVGRHSETLRYSHADRASVLLDAQNVIDRRTASGRDDWPYIGGIA